MSMDASLRNSATQTLKTMEVQPGFLVLLLNVLSSKFSLPICQAGAIYFKNFVMQHWVPDTDKDIINESDRCLVKSHIVELMLNSPKQVQLQLSQALAIVSKADFPSKWNSLLPELVSKLANNDYKVIIGVLETLHSIFHRYRHEMKSTELWKEIKYVLETFQEPMLKIFQQTCSLIGANEGNKEVLTQLFKSLNLIANLFYSLNAQDIPEYFEDHMKDWFGPFENFLKFKNPLLDPPSDDQSGVLDELQAQICEIVGLYTNAYEEQFNEFVPVFVNTTWNLLTQLDDKPRYDPLVMTAIRFLTSVVKKTWHKELFNNEAALKVICEKIVIPQIKLRDSDIELFSDDGLEYIRRNVEGSDNDTRRRTTMDFVQGLCLHFEAQITEILKGYVANLLTQYAANPTQNWVMKDAAMYIILALAVKGTTAAKGATKTNNYVNIIDFFGTQVLPELQDANQSSLRILKSDCLKFVSVFRQQLPTEAFPVLVPILSRYLASDEYVLHTMAAHSLERMFSVKEDEGNLRLNKEAFKPFIQGVLQGLFNVLEMEESKENEYIMKCIMRVCAVAEDAITPFAPIVMSKITSVLSDVSKNPKNPQFNHYLFETLSCLITNICKAQPEAVGHFESALFPPLQTMLGMETCQEFGTYCFQILAHLLERRSSLSDAYKSVFPAVLVPMLWDNEGNVPALVRLIQAYLEKPDAKEVLADGKLDGVLGIFQKLNASRKMDHHGLELLGSLVESTELSVFDQYLPTICRLFFARLQDRKTPKFVQNLVVFFSRFVCKHGVEPLLAGMNAVQPNIFCMVLEKIWLPNIQSILTPLDRKLCGVALCKLLCSSPAMLQQPYVAMWPNMLAGVLNFFEVPAQPKAAEEDIDLLDLSDKSFSTAYCRLSFAAAKVRDTLSQVSNTRHHFASEISSFRQKFPNEFNQFLQNVPAAQQSVLQKYLQGQVDSNQLVA
eukprot:CAMPEP_0175130734 /NCGR_PEP_ID=MMETSP0087-20121206/6161_1 /TAXON_ID=136419 /ORGANISM="Unknown Unknown, Strain D1" /LENGTH=952 /DNA_ID=CAMNT_0016412965 /DNA_START=72 /DNA_END=2930 /DNA_ORIENTATION=+